MYALGNILLMSIVDYLRPKVQMQKMCVSVFPCETVEAETL